MPQPLDAVLSEVRELLLDPALTRAVAAGRRRGATPSVQRAELRPVALKSGIRLQIVTDDGARPYTRNEPYGPDATAAVDALLAEPFGNWHVETATQTVQVRVTKKGDAQVHRAAAPGAGPAAGGDAQVHRSAAAGAGPAAGGHAATASPSNEMNADVTPSSGVLASTTDRADTSHRSDGAGVAVQHDRVKQWLLEPGDPLFRVIGGTAAKRRQVDAFLRSLAATLPNDPADWPSPLRVVDLGCGNAYLTFAAYRYLTSRGAKVQVVGVDVRDDQRIRNSAVAADLGYSDDVHFVAGTIEDAHVTFEPDDAHVTFEPDLVLALHACDTATDQALARAVRWNARWVLAAPCCHHDIAAQLKGTQPPPPYGDVTRSPILRERLADVLTDSLRASLLRINGYKVEVVEFVDSAHTPRNLLLRARHTGVPGKRDDYEALTAQWGVTPALEKLLT